MHRPFVCACANSKEYNFADAVCGTSTAVAEFCMQIFTLELITRRNDEMEKRKEEKEEKEEEELIMR